MPLFLSEYRNGHGPIERVLLDPIEVGVDPVALSTEPLHPGTKFRGIVPRFEPPILECKTTAGISRIQIAEIESRRDGPVPISQIRGVDPVNGDELVWLTHAVSIRTLQSKDSR